MSKKAVSNQNLEAESPNNNENISANSGVNSSVNNSANNTTNNNVKKTIMGLLKETLIILLGTFVMALGFQIFLTPHNIVPGGFMGVAKIVYDVISKTGFTAIPISVWYIILNVFLYLYAVKNLGWKFAIRAGVGIFSLSLFLDLIEQTTLIDSIITQFETEAATSYILYAIYGGILMGTGIGLVFRGNGSTGGCDMVAVVTNKFFPTITTGQIIIVVDGLVVLLSSVVYGSLVLPLYALITIFISGKVSDMFVDGVRSLRAYYVVTSKKEELSQEILNKLDRGVTNLKCEGMFTHNDKDMLLIIVRRAQVIKLKKIVKRIDPNSFMFSHNVKEAFGNGFVAHSKEKQKNKNIQFENVKIDNARIENTETENVSNINMETEISKNEVTANETSKPQTNKKAVTSKKTKAKKEE